MFNSEIPLCGDCSNIYECADPNAVCDYDTRKCVCAYGFFSDLDCYGVCEPCKWNTGTSLYFKLRQKYVTISFIKYKYVDGL